MSSDPVPEAGAKAVHLVPQIHRRLTVVLALLRRGRAFHMVRQCDCDELFVVTFQHRLPHSD
jgi:hypothetical protein